MFLRFSLTAASIALALAVSTAAFAAPQAKKELTPQQQRMADCNKQATGKKGAERKDFMKTCLSKKEKA